MTEFLILVLVVYLAFQVGKVFGRRETVQTNLKRQMALQLKAVPYPFGLDERITKQVLEETNSPG